MINFLSNEDNMFWFLVILNFIVFLIGLRIGFLEGYKYGIFCTKKYEEMINNDD